MKYLTILFNKLVSSSKRTYGRSYKVGYYKVNRKTGRGYESTMKGEILRER